MIAVTRLNGTPMMLNSDLIKIAESSPDTMLTLIHGEKLIVRESCSEIVDMVVAYRARLLAAVAAVSVDDADLQRIVALASVNPDSSGDEATAPGEGAKAAVKLQVEPGGRRG